MDNDGRRWETVQAAAHLLSVSERTIHRMAKDGRLSSKHEGARLYVDITDHVPPEPEPEADLVSLSAQVARLQTEVDRLTDLVDRQDKEIEFLRQAHAAALRLQQVAIESPKRRFRWPWQADD